MGKSEKKEGAFEYFPLALRCMKCGRSRQSNHIFLSDALRSFCALLLNFFFVLFFELKSFFPPNFYFRVHSIYVWKKENLFCHCVESPNVTYKSKCICTNFETTQIVLRMNATENKHDFDPTRTDIMTKELSICDSRNAIRRQPSKNIKKICFFSNRNCTYTYPKLWKYQINISAINVLYLLWMT